MLTTFYFPAAFIQASLTQPAEKQKIPLFDLPPKSWTD
jgi:hypothetical protein